jgi:hypothetical protein
VFQNTVVKLILTWSVLLSLLNMFFWMHYWSMLLKKKTTLFSGSKLEFWVGSVFLFQNAALPHVL